MNKKSKYVAGWALCLTTAIAGVGTALGASIADNTPVIAVKAATEWVSATMNKVKTCSLVSVNGINGILVGSGTKSGSMSITVPAGATKLKFSAAAWNGVAGMSISFTGISADPSAFTLIPDAGFNMSGTKLYTAADDASIYEFATTLSDVTENTVITVTTTTPERFVLWGAYYALESEPTPVSDLSLNKTSLSLVVGENDTLVATPLPSTADDKTVVWSSSDESIATVSSTGVVTAKSEGIVVIYATATNGTADTTDDVIADCSVEVMTKVAYVNNLIANLGPVEYTDAYKEKLDAARAAYNSLSDEEKLQANGDILTDKENGYVYAGQAAVVDDLIAQIGTVVYTDECKEKIDAANAAMNSLSYEAMGYLKNYETLAAATYDYNELQNQVNQVIFIIEDIGTVDENTFDYVGPSIEIARSNYDNLDDNQKNGVTNYGTLTAAESAYAALQDQVNAANNVGTLINALGETTQFTPEYKAKIDAARTAYDALTDFGKDHVYNYYWLTKAETEYQKYETDKDAAENVEAMIAMLPVYEAVTLDNKPAIVAARTAYDALTADQQGLVSDALLDKLVGAEYAIAELEKKATDKAAADEVAAQINALPAEITLDNKEAVVSARSAYDALTSDQKTFIDDQTLGKLVAAEETIAALEPDAADAAKAQELVTLLDAIPEGDELTLDYQEAVETARTAYDDMTPAQIAKLPEGTLEKLEALEARITELLADKAAADEVIALIDALPEEITLDNKEAVVSARSAYDALTNVQKAGIDAEKLAKLTAAESTLKTLEKAAADQAEADKVTALIDAIGEVDASEQSKEKIDAARTAYDALTEEQKALVGPAKLSALTTAETDYAAKVEAAKGLPGGAIAGIVAGSIAGVALIVCLIFFILHKKGIYSLPFIRKK